MTENGVLLEIMLGGQKFFGSEISVKKIYIENMIKMFKTMTGKHINITDKPVFATLLPMNVCYIKCS